jgi:alpha-tubulin suppressor-like RCC1 family protein
MSDSYYGRISAGHYHAAAIKCDGTLWLWGSGRRGKFGDNSITCHSSPVQTISGGTNWKQVSLSGSSSSAIKTDGTLWLWGPGFSGSLGNNSTIYRSSPVQTIAGGTNWKQVSLGTWNHSSAIKTDGTLWLWGSGCGGKLGANSISSQSSPVQTISGGTNWKQASLGYDHSSAIKTDGTLWLWGYGDGGNLGNNSITRRSSPVQTTSGGTNWKQVSLGYCHSTAIKTDGTLWLWGCQGFQNCRATSALGDGTVIDRSSPVQTVSGGTSWKFVSGGWDQSAAIKTDGTLWTWGLNCDGNLGDGTREAKSSPVQTIFGGNDWKDVSSGRGYCNYKFVLATKTDGSLWSWGSNDCGQLGQNRTTGYYDTGKYIVYGDRRTVDFDDVFVPRDLFSDGGLWVWGCGGVGRLGTNNQINQSSPVQTISGGTDWKMISKNGGIKSDGTLWLWAEGFAGRLGNNSIANQSSPLQTISGGTNWKQVSLDTNHSSAIKTDGTLWLWGYGCAGRLGANNLISQSSPVQTISGGTNWKQVNISTDHSSAIKTDGTLWLWGCCDNGELGSAVCVIVSLPSPTNLNNSNGWKTCILPEDDIMDFSAGVSQSSAIKTDGTLWLWGCGGDGRLGDGSNTDRSSPVQTISGGTNWKQVSIGCRHSSAIKTDGTLWLWGRGSGGNLGTNTTIFQSSPLQTISGGTNWKQVSLGNGHSSAIKTDGTLWLWGYGGTGRLGTNSATNRSSPVQTISGGTNWKQVSLGIFHSSAIKTDGTLWLWGQGFAGPLGTNTIIDQSSPVQTISGGTNWKQVSLGCAHSSAIKTDGTLWLWGQGFAGRLGNGDGTNQSSPVQTVSGGTNWKQVSLGWDHSSAIKTDGTLWLWGNANVSKLGDNSFIIKSSPVQTISGGTNWCAVSLGTSSTIASKDTNELFVFGSASQGKLGITEINLDVSALSPVQTISGGTDWKQVSIGYKMSSAIKTDGSLWLWGRGTWGALGNNSTSNRSSPVQTISGGTNWKQVSLGRIHSSAIKTDGTLWLWGCGAGGALGNNSTTWQSSPVQTISGGTNWKEVSIDRHSSAIKTDGTLWVWGCGLAGAMGDNSEVNQSSPVQTVAGGTNWKSVEVSQTGTFAIREDCW